MRQLGFQRTCAIPGLSQIRLYLCPLQDLPQAIGTVYIDEKGEGQRTGLENLNFYAPGGQLGTLDRKGFMHGGRIRLHPAEQIGRFDAGHNRRTLGNEGHAKISAHKNHLSVLLVH